MTDLVTALSIILSRCVHYISRLPWRISFTIIVAYLVIFFLSHYLDPFADHFVGSGPGSPLLPPNTSPLLLPDDYGHLHDDSPHCASLLGLEYLMELRRSRATYCTDAAFQFTCFHSQIEQNSRTDSFCVGNAAQIDQALGRFKIGCEMVEPRTIELNESSVPLDKFTQYWYETGPNAIIKEFVEFEPHIQSLSPSRENGTNIILIKREGTANPWHSLMEIMSLSMSLDVLQITPSDRPGQEGLALLTPEDGDNTQVVILDDKDDGPYFDLWRLFAKRPTIRLSDVPAETNIRDIIIPLAGGSNPVWRGDWEPHDCGHSDLLRTFSRRILRHLDVAEDTGASRDSVVVTFVHRVGTRKLEDIEGHITALKHRYTDTHASINLIDLATLSLAEQVSIVHNSDVLAGVHGAGLTHGMWMRERSVMVEILPADLNHKGFRNLAGALGHSYFSAHGSATEEHSGNWQNDDVALDRDKFIEIMDLAIKSMYNTGRLNFDASR